MIGCYYIDGVDIYTQYGVSVTEGGYEGLFSYPALKIPDSNDWSEEDGLGVSIFLSERSCSCSCGNAWAPAESRGTWIRRSMVGERIGAENTDY